MVDDTTLLGSMKQAPLPLASIWQRSSLVSGVLLPTEAFFSCFLAQKNCIPASAKNRITDYQIYLNSLQQICRQHSPTTRSSKKVVTSVWSATPKFIHLFKSFDFWDWCSSCQYLQIDSICETSDLYSTFQRLTRCRNVRHIARSRRWSWVKDLQGILRHVSYAQFHIDVTDVESQQSAGDDLSQEHSFVKDWKPFCSTFDYEILVSGRIRSYLDFVRSAKNAAKAMSFPLPPRLRRRLTDFETTKEAKILWRFVDVVWVFLFPLKWKRLWFCKQMV